MKRGRGGLFDSRLTFFAAAADVREMQFQALSADGASRPYDDAPEHELRALVRVSAAVAGALGLDDVLAVAAEEAREALGSSTVSISRWDRPAGTLQTLINVGELAAGEERRPKAEYYPLAQFPRAFALLSQGQAHLTNADDPDADPNEILLLSALAKRSCFAVPILHGGATWGELYAAAATDSARRFDEGDVRFMGAVAGQIAVAIARAEVFSRIERFAFEDPLTGLANRRALDERVATAMEHAEHADEDVALVLCDVDDLKHVNDVLGHDAGDRQLLATADALRAVAATRSGALAARIGGDEFCLLLEQADIREGQRAARELSDRVGTSILGVTVSSGVAAMRLGPRRAADLFRLADAAQYRAKRMGPGRVCVAAREMPLPEPGRRLRRRAHGEVAGSLERLLSDTLELLDTALADATPLERLAAVADACAHAEGVEGWAVSRHHAEAAQLETVLRAGPGFPGEDGATCPFRVDGDVYALSDYPATERVLREGGVLVVAADDPFGDPSEQAYMRRDGRAQLLAVGVETAEATMLVELFADATIRPLGRLAPFLRVLLTEAARSR